MLLFLLCRFSAVDNLCPDVIEHAEHEMQFRPCSYFVLVARRAPGPVVLLLLHWQICAPDGVALRKRWLGRLLCLCAEHGSLARRANRTAPLLSYSYLVAYRSCSLQPASQTS